MKSALKASINKIIIVMLVISLAIQSIACATTINIVQPVGEPPIVRISDNKYSIGNPISLMQVASEQECDRWSMETRDAYIKSSVAKAEELGLNSDNLNDILNKLLINIGQLDFYNKNITSSGKKISFMISERTVQLPYLIEKATYRGKQAWMVVLKWEVDKNKVNDQGLGHFAIVVFEYGSDNVLFAASCI